MLPLAESKRASGAALAVDALLLPKSSTSIAASRPLFVFVVFLLCLWSE